MIYYVSCSTAFAFIVATDRTSVLGSLLIGSACMILILVRYVHSRHLFASLQASDGLSSTATASGVGGPTAGKIKVDKMLLLRFAIAFAILSAFEVSLILFQFSRQENAPKLAEQDHPDFGLGSTISEILQFMPGVTASLLAFLLFGTTVHFQQRYKESFKSLRWRRRRRSSLEVEGSRDVWGPLEVNGRSYRYTVRAGEDVEGLELHDTASVPGWRASVMTNGNGVLGSGHCFSEPSQWQGR
jgi:hypothetical protein